MTYRVNASPVDLGNGGVSDPLTFAVVPIVLVLVALAACCVPARRATHVDPMEALGCQ